MNVGGNGLSFKNATDILLRPAYTKDDLAAREVAIKSLLHMLIIKLFALFS